MATKPQTDEPPAPEHPRPHSHRFFEWMRSLGIVRDNGWIGGVAAGIAARLGIDPLIVRGILVVVAVLGGPAVLLYAIAWLLLPDRKNVIHLDELMHGRFTAAHAGIAVLALLSFLPVAQGFWNSGWNVFGTPSWIGGLGRAVWTVVLIAIAVAVVVWIARRSSSPAKPTVVTDATATPVTTVVEPVAAAPTEPAAGSAPSDFAEWRERQTAWKAENDAFRAEQAATEKEAAARRAAEQREYRDGLAAEYAERRRVQRLANPRLSAAWVFVVLGLGLLAGGVAAIVAANIPDWKGGEVAAGFGVATLTVGLAIVVVGVARRRSGFLSFVGIVLLIGTVGTALVPHGSTFVLVEGSAATGTFTEPAGTFSVFPLPKDTGTLDVWQGVGQIYIYVPQGRTIRVEASQGNGYFQNRTVYSNYNGSVHLQPTSSNGPIDSWDRTYGTAAVPDLIIRVWQGSGYIAVADNSDPTRAYPGVVPTEGDAK